MNYEELEKKYNPYTLEGFTGIEFWLDEEYNGHVSELLDEIIKIYPDFRIAQLKIKYDKICFHTNLPLILEKLCEQYIQHEYEFYKIRVGRNVEQESKECNKS